MKDILIYDIETSLNGGCFWRPGSKVNISPDNITEERKVMSIAYKWYGAKAVKGLIWTPDKDDSEILTTFAEVLGNASASVAHNGDQFDIKWLRGRCLYHNIPFSPFEKTIDTCKISRGLFNLNSHKLDYLNQFLGGKGKSFTGGFDLWKRLLMTNTAKDRKTLLDYNKNDVLILEDTFKRLQPYMKPSAHFGVLHGSKTWDCPHCGSADTVANKSRASVTGAIRVQLRCHGCSGYYTLSSQVYDKKVLYEDGL